MVLTLGKHPNVHIYGSHDCKFPHNLANYYNESHYQPDVNRYMMFSIKNNLHILTPENIDLYEQQMLENLKNFEIKESYFHNGFFRRSNTGGNDKVGNQTTLLEPICLS